jgi:hypothetical protein
MVALGGEELQLLLILDLGTRWGWVVSVTPRPRFAPGKGPRVPIVQEAGWAPEPVWTQRLEENSLPLLGIEPCRPVFQSVVRHYTDWATPAPCIDKCRYEIQEQKGIPVWYTGIHRPISNTGYRFKSYDLKFRVYNEFYFMYHNVTTYEPYFTSLKLRF